MNGGIAALLVLSSACLVACIVAASVLATSSSARNHRWTKQQRKEFGQSFCKGLTANQCDCMANTVSKALPYEEFVRQRSRKITSASEVDEEYVKAELAVLQSMKCAPNTNADLVKHISNNLTRMCEIANCETCEDAQAFVKERLCWENSVMSDWRVFKLMYVMTASSSETEQILSAKHLLEELRLRCKEC